jgi:MFS family permease
MVNTYRSPGNWRFGDAIKTRTLWAIVIAIAFIYYLWQTILTQTPAHLHDRGFSPSDPVLVLQPAFVYGLILAFSIIGRLSVSFLGERIESRYIISIAGLSLLIGGVLFWLASRENLWAVYLYPLFTGFGFGATYVCQPLIIGNYFGVGSFAAISRISSPIGSIFQYSAPAIAGFIYDINGNYAPAVIIGCAGAFIGMLLILFCVPPKPVSLEA